MGMASPESSCLLIIASENVKKVSKSQVWEKELDLNISEEECNVLWDHTNKKKSMCVITRSFLRSLLFKILHHVQISPMKGTRGTTNFYLCV